MNDRIRETGYSLLVGDMLVSLIWPRQHARLWRTLVPLSVWQSAVGWFEDRPWAMRAAGLIEGGIALRQLQRLYANRR